MRIRILFLVILNLLAISNSYAVMGERIAIETHVYKNVAIQAVKGKESDIQEIHILGSQVKPNTIQSKNFSMPTIGSLFWTISLSDLRVPEEACLEIDATLCKTYSEIGKTGGTTCYNSCITSGLKFVAYDEKNQLLYIDAGSDVTGTAGEPRFLFSADIKNKKIKYLNTFMSPYDAYLSTAGSYIAISRGNKEIDICKTDTGNFFKIIGENNNSNKDAKHHALGSIRWINDYQLQYKDLYYNDKFQSIANLTTEKVCNVITKRST